MGAPGTSVEDAPRGLRAVAFAALVGVGCAATNVNRVVPEGAVVQAYDDMADANHLRARLSARRVEAGRAPAAPFLVAQQNLENAKDWIKGGMDAQVALDDAFQSSADLGERTVYYWAYSVQSLDDVGFPAELIRARGLNVALSLMRVRQGDRTGYLVLLVVSAYSIERYETE